jgi:EpsI family protein
MKITKLITLFVVILVGAVYTITYKPGSASSSIQNLDEKSLQLPGWSFLNDIQMDYRQYTALDPNSLIFRNYQDESGEVVNLTVVYHQNDRWGAHDPVICYESQGWKVSPIDQMPSVVIEGRRIMLNGFTVRKAQHNQLVYYLWFSSREKLVSNRARQMFDMVFSGLFRGYIESGFIRFSINATPVDLEYKSHKLKNFIKAFIEVFKAT